MAIYMYYIPEEQNWNLMCSSETIFEFFTAVFCWRIVQVKQNIFFFSFFFSFFFQNCLKPLFFDSTVSIYFDSQETSIIIAVITTDCGCHITVLLPLADGVSSGAATVLDIFV